MSYVSPKLLIDGAWQGAGDGQIIPVINPATGTEIGHVPRATLADLERAVVAAQKGFAIWKDTSAHDRADLMRRAASLLRERADSIARLLTLEQGKPVAEARGEVLAGAAIVEWFADEALRLYGRIVPARRADVVQQVIKEPVGPVAAFTPWNFPVNQIVRKLSAALSAGCSFICKGPEETPASPAELFQCFVDAGIPAGVIGLVYGDPATISGYLVPHPAIRKVTFTGSTEVGKRLAALAGAHMKRCTMELGGHAPVIIAEDADVELAVRSLAPAKFRNAGQICISPTRFLVHRSILKPFTDALAKTAESIQVGDGLEPGTQMGPLVSERRVRAMETMVRNAVQSGGELVMGGKRIGDIGSFYSPTVLLDVPLSAEVFNQEPFGPIAAIRGFDSLEDAVEEANRLPYGLAAYAFTRSLKTAHLLTRRIETGMLWINQPASASAEMPFGGVKDSGFGSEGGPEALDAYLVPKAVSVAMI